MTRSLLAKLLCVACCLEGVATLSARQPSSASDDSWLRPYTGPTRTDVDATTLDGKGLCNTPCDGEGFGFGHWGQNLGETNGHFVVDMWPDTSEYDPKDLCAVPG